MRFSGLFSALGLPVVSLACALTGAVCLTGCLGGDDTSVAPPPVVDAGADATTAKDAESTVVVDKDSGDDDASEKDAEADANPFGG